MLTLYFRADCTLRWKKSSMAGIYVSFNASRFMPFIPFISPMQLMAIMNKMHMSAKAVVDFLIVDTVLLTC